MPTDNIFSALAKYNSAKDENYLTEAFVFLINSLLERQQLFGLELLTWLCVNDDEFRFGTDEAISVSTQETTEQGRPDIRVSSPDKLIYVEVKHDSPLGTLQLARYGKALESSPASIKHVVLLTRFPVDFDEQEERPYKHVRWFEVYSWLDSAKMRATDSVSIYLMESFNSFLEAKQMSVQRVGWEYIGGVPAMLNLINMIEVAIQGAGLRLYAQYPRAPALGSRGFYIETNTKWCGIHFDDPLHLSFEVYGKDNYDKNRLESPSYPIQEDKRTLWFRLPLEDHHFFSLNKDEQLELITKFMKTANSEFEQMRGREATET